MPPSREEEIEARLKAATPGPWEWVGSDLEQVAGEHKSVVEAPRESCCDFGCCGGHGTVVSEADQALTAHAPSDLRYLLDENRRMREAFELIEELRWGQINACGDAVGWTALSALFNRALDIAKSALSPTPAPQAERGK